MISTLVHPDKQQAGSSGAIAHSRTGSGRSMPARTTIQKAEEKTNGPVTGAAVVQRQLTVKNIDYNPADNEYRDGFITENDFYNALHDRIWQNVNFNGFRGQWQNVRQAMEGEDFEGADINALSEAVITGLVNEYQARNLVLAGGQRNTMKTYVTECLAGHITADHAVAMDQQERTGFDQLAGIVGAAAMSRSKGVATQIPFAQLPGALQGQVTAITTEIADEKAHWTLALLNADGIRDYFFANYAAFDTEIIRRQRNLHYQGNHTNNAGWLPAVAVPANVIEPGRLAIKAAASNRLWRICRQADSQDRLGITGPNAARPNAFRAPYNAFVVQHVTPITLPQLRESAMAALCQNVSAYIEFNMGGGISRFIYDPVNDTRYITAHYKWRNGYNPFFRIT